MNHTQIEVREHPVIFSTVMVQAILEGRKTQTRRVIKPQPEFLGKHKMYQWGNATGNEYFLKDWASNQHILPKFPYGQVGDRLWVRETWAIIKENDGVDISDMSQNSGLFYKADNSYSEAIGKWRPSIFMPHWASRITLEITGVRVERLQEITEEDATAEGICFNEWAYCGKYAKDIFKELWNSLNAKRGYGWETNCWVWVITFRRLTDE